jgi:thioredoxin-dependent peroxiredoxin
MLTLNTKAPEFTLLDQDGKPVSLSDYMGRMVLVYFYPKDDTPGCTKEACMITELYDEFEKADIIVLGVSVDSPESHTIFRKKYNLPFTLLSDPKKEVIRAYGALGGVLIRRISYLINKDGMIVKAYMKVDPATHAAEILADAIL